MFVEEAAALASITLFVGMIAVWAQLIPQLWCAWRPARSGGLGKSRMAGARSAFRVDSARPRHHHCGGESARMSGRRSLPPRCREPV